MIQIERFTFNPFQENTYILYDASSDCVIIDPGCYDAGEEQELVDFIHANDLNPVKVVNTHCHIDHVFGNAFCVRNFKIPLWFHKKEIPVLESGDKTAMMYALRYHTSPEADNFLQEGQKLKWGKSEMDIVFTPGHSPGSVCFIGRKEKMVIGGDVLFQMSIGRTDLPGGDHQTLLDSIRRELFTLPDDFTVHPGHGPSTTIGFEKEHNPFL